MQKLFIGVIMFFSFLNAFEVNTHQALTRCAITSSCSNGYSKNLYNFVTHAGIKYQSYANEIFEKYGNNTTKYVDYANEGLGFANWNILIKNPDYIGMIEAGSVLEDAVFQARKHLLNLLEKEMDGSTITSMQHSLMLKIVVTLKMYFKLYLIMGKKKRCFLLVPYV